MLILTRDKGQSIVVGDDIVVTVLGVQGKQVKVGIRAPDDVAVDRGEVREAKGVKDVDSADGEG